MDSAELGKRIKEARLARKMTQADVVGDFITRNMLSQIESGTANPSVKTLTYLAKVLQLPVNYLLPDELETYDDSENASNKDVEALIRMKSAYKQGSYTAAAEVASPFAEDTGNIVYDEACSVLAMSYFELAKAADDPKEGIAFAKKAEEYAQKGIFAKREIRASAVLLIDELSDKL
ncbi:MAG: helix-turn-helix transcriptional regulator [Ruminiclostridium sp.]|nr:helix-turn-helix transcriptional regulator [Ruminiclostridium sp.]